MTAHLTDLDKQLVARVRQLAEVFRVCVSLNAAQANTIGDHLDDFARGLDDLMADHLGMAEDQLERDERGRDIDPKGRRMYARVETESPR